MQKFTGLQYLMIDVASNYGLDKATWQERLSWFQQHEDHLMEMLPTADVPALFYAGVQAYEKAKQGISSGYAISLDATSSGLQILSALTGDRSAAALCNVINKPLDFSPEAEAERRDGYTVIYNAMVELLGEEGKISRDDCKQAIMTSLYGSQAIPKQIFGEGVLLQAFNTIMAELAPAVWELNQFFLDMWNPENLVNSWVLPDNFHVHVKVMDRVQETVHFLNEPFDTFRNVNQPTEEGRSLGANTTHSIDGMIVREMTRRCNYSPSAILRVHNALDNLGVDGTEADDEMVLTLWNHYQESGFLSARILDHLFVSNIDLVNRADIQHLLASLPSKPFQIMSIHDCFRCLPNYGNDLRQQYNNLLTEVAKSDLLQYLISQLMGKKVTIGKLDSEMWKEVAQAEYALS